MIERLILLSVLAVAGVIAYQLVRRWQVQRVARFADHDPLLANRQPDTPAIVYFSTPFCLPCKTQQRPAIQRLVDEMGGDVQVIEVNATEQPDVATRWGVLSVPTTFILDRSGQPRQINHGVTGLETLRHQMQRL